ncbi:MAG: DUF4160 domain-containing protein [Lysobacterales bacterium]
MPTVLRQGPYRFFWYSHEPNEPAHVHIDRDQCSAKFWLEPVGFARNIGFSRHELKTWDYHKGQPNIFTGDLAWVLWHLTRTNGVGSDPKHRNPTIYRRVVGQSTAYSTDAGHPVHVIAVRHST